MTRFQILTRDDSGLWHEHGTQEGHSAADAATKSYLKKPDGGVKAIVAIPLRSWRPTPIRSEPQPPKVILGEPKEQS